MTYMLLKCHKNHENIKTSVLDQSIELYRKLFGITQLRSTLFQQPACY